MKIGIVLVMVFAMITMAGMALAAGLCTETAGTPTLGTCADNGCAATGKECKAVDTDGDEIKDTCNCVPPVPEFATIGITAIIAAAAGGAIGFNVGKKKK